MQNTKRTTRYLLVGLIILALCALIVVGITSLFPAPPRVTYDSYASPSGEVALILEYKEPFVFGPHHFFVYGQRQSSRVIPGLWDRYAWLPGGRKLLLEFDVANDGARIDGANDGARIDGTCSVRWFNEGVHEIARLTCDGQEQDPESYLIDVTKSMRWN